MKSADFESFWKSNYPDTPPIGHYFKHHFPERWFRIHSLPNSKRYPSSEEHWKILLERQNTILDDLFPKGADIFLVVAVYESRDGFIELHPTDAVASIKQFSFTKMTPYDLYSLNPELYEKGHTETAMFTEQRWQPHSFDAVLRDLADDDLEAFFISVESNCIAAPYDGGMDILLPDPASRDRYKKKYSAWLSPREDGL